MTENTAPPDLLTDGELIVLLDGGAGRPYMTELVDERSHALQTAELAMRDGADDELIVAAAMHDIGRARPVALQHPGLPHETAGAAFASQRLSERIAWVVGHHVPAKRFLVATDRSYQRQLSPASVTTLAQQGGPMSPAEVAQFREKPWHGDAVRLRCWDDQAKDPDRAGLAMAELAAIFGRWRSVAQRRVHG